MMKNGSANKAATRKDAKGGKGKQAATTNGRPFVTIEPLRVEGLAAVGDPLNEQGELVCTSETTLGERIATLPLAQDAEAKRHLCSDLPRQIEQQARLAGLELQLSQTVVEPRDVLAREIVPAVCSHDRSLEHCSRSVDSSCEEVFVLAGSSRHSTNLESEL